MCLQAVEEVGGAPVHPSPSDPVTFESDNTQSGEPSELHASDVDATSEASVEEASDVLAWEFMWVAVLVLAILGGIGITAICLY